MTFEDKCRREIRKILEKDARYDMEAFVFVQRGVSAATRRFHPDATTERRHITGQQLVEVLRDLAVDQFGPLALDVLNEWNVRTTRDFGNIVFLMVENGLLGASEEDSVEDFTDVFDLPAALTEPFKARGPKPADLTPIA